MTCVPASEPVPCGPGPPTGTIPGVTDPSPGAAAPRGAPLSSRRLATTVMVAVVAALAVVGVASLQNDPVGEGPQDQAPIIAGVVTPQGQELTGGDSQLPPLSIVLPRALPANIRDLPAEQQVVSLREAVAQQPTVRRYVDLGRAYMDLADGDSAAEAFGQAAKLAPSDPEPLVGLAMSRAVSSDTGLQAASGELESLAQRFPESQVVVFNQGWLALYRPDVATVTASWKRTVQLGPRTPLGLLAADLLKQISEAGG